MYSSAQNCKIYVGNLPDYIRPKDIEDIFWKFGRIRNVDLHDRSRGPPFAFVEFDDERGSEDAVYYRNGYDFEGYRLRVEAPRTPKYLTRPSRDRDPYDRLGDPWGYPPRSSRPQAPPRRKRRSSSRRGEFRVTVSGLPRSASWQDLKDHFREAGDIAYTDVSSDGTGVLEFSSRKTMDYALKHFDDTKFRSHQGESSYIRVRVCRRVRKSPSRSRSRTRSRERRSHSRSKSRSPHRGKRSRSRDRDDGKSKRQSDRRGRDSRDASRDNSVYSADPEDSPRPKKRKESKRKRSESMSSGEDEKPQSKMRQDRGREDSKGSLDDSSRENSIELSPSKSSDRSMKGSVSPAPNSQFPAEQSEERTPDVSLERQPRSKSGSRGSTPQDSSESRKSSPSSSRSASPLGNSHSSSPDLTADAKDASNSLPAGQTENGAERKGEEIGKEESLSDEPQSMDS